MFGNGTVAVESCWQQFVKCESNLFALETVWSALSLFPDVVCVPSAQVAVKHTCILQHMRGLQGERPLSVPVFTRVEGSEHMRV